MTRTDAPRTMEVLRLARAGTVGALAVLIVAQGLQQTSYGAAQQLVVLRLIDLTGAKEAQVLTGVTFAAGGIATALASLTYHRLLRRTSYRRLITAGAVLLGLALLGAAAAATAPFVIAAFVVASFFSGALAPAFGAMTGLEAPAIVQATVFGVGSSAIALGFGLGPLIGGLVASAAGIRAGLLVAAALALILAALVGIRAREPRPHRPV
jgi:MFS family permease